MVYHSTLLLLLAGGHLRTRAGGRAKKTRRDALEEAASRGTDALEERKAATLSRYQEGVWRSQSSIRDSGIEGVEGQSVPP